MHEIKKVLFCATVDYHLELFHVPYLKWFKERGWEVHVAAAGQHALPYVDQKFDLSIQRSPFSKKNIAAYRELKEIIHSNDYEIIHCHTPMGGVLARLAARKARKRGTKVIYTAHGFHFCKGAPALNWMLYYPIERMLARYTDCLITINQEDEEFARRHLFHAGRIEHVHGVGVDTEKFKPAEEEQKDEWRKANGYEPGAFLMFYAAEFNKNKNQQLLIRSMALVQGEMPDARLLLAGEGPLLEECLELAVELGVDQMIDFLGYREDIALLLKHCDLAVASSLREGLPVNIMEAMACGLPVVASDNRGHRELIEHDENGWLLMNNQSAMEMSERFKQYYQDEGMRAKAGKAGRDMAIKQFSVEKVLMELSEIYLSYTGQTEESEWAIQ